MKIVIIEDEALAAERLENLLLDIDPEIEVLAKIESVRKSVEWLRENTPDLVFLDIQLSDGISFNIFDEVKINIPIIFTTAYDQYAIRAFKVNSISYLLKPVRREDLLESLAKFKELRLNISPDINEILQSLKNKNIEYKKRFLIQYGQKIKKVEIEEISCFYALEKNVFLVTFQNAVYPVDFTLDNLEEIIDPDKYFRINRKLIINYESIKNMISYSKSRIRIELPVKLPEEIEPIVSVERSPNFKKWLNK
jgi:DNA-binding LytR/AlgR family response regulator